MPTPLWRGGNRVAMALQNVTHHKLVLRKGTIVATVMAVNVVPPHAHTPS